MMVGLFGGTFDPVHAGHERMIRAALGLGLQRVVVMPCCLSPHKTDAAVHALPADGRHRLRMLELAVGGVAGVEISTYELTRGGVSFTWQTLEFLREKFTTARLALIVGLDQYREFPRWERFAEWGRGLDIYVFGREGAARPAAGAAYDGPVYHWPEERIPPVSASAIRQRARAGQDLDGLVSQPVAEYIKSHRLYLTDTET